MCRIETVPDSEGNVYHVQKIQSAVSALSAETVFVTGDLNCQGKTGLSKVKGW